MRRRTLIVGAGAALSGVAGCLGEERTALSERPPENAVEDALRTAVGEANAVALRLATAREDADDVAAIEIDENALEGRLDDARAALDGAGDSGAASDYREELDAAGTYVDVVAGLFGGSASLAATAEQLDRFEADLQAGDDARAADTLDALQPTVGDARTTLSQARSDVNSLDGAVLDPYGARLAELTEGLETVGSVAAGADEFAAGYDSLLAGRGHLEDGADAFEGREFASAASEFRAAGEAFDAATDHFETARTEIDGVDAGDLGPRIDVAHCRSMALSDAASDFEAAADAGDAGALREARDRYDAGQADVETAENCG